MFGHSLGAATASSTSRNAAHVTLDADIGNISKWEAIDLLQNGVDSVSGESTKSNSL
jgi:hypothetical protein